MKKVYIAICFLLVSNFSMATGLESWLASEIESHQEGLYFMERESGSTLDLSLIRLRVRATLSLELPLVAKGKVRPEIEFYFSK